MSGSKTVSNPTYKPIPHPATPYKDFNSFYPFYLGEHSKRINRIFHLTGTSIAILIYLRTSLSGIASLILKSGLTNRREVLDLAIKLRLPLDRILRLLGIGLLQGYFFAWLGHFFVEKNRPATFKYPLFSLRGDFKLLWEVLTLQRRL